MRSGSKRRRALYATSPKRDKNGKNTGRAQLMHRFILGLGRYDGKNMVDHIDGNGLNNQKKNLRVVPQWVNMRNTYKNRSGALHGTTFNKAMKKYLAILATGKGKSVYIGAYDTKEEAHEAYLSAETKLFPDRVTKIQTYTH